MIPKKPDFSKSLSTVPCYLYFKLRNPQRDFTFATVRGSSVDMYFKSQVEYDTIYRTMEGRNVGSVDEGIQVCCHNWHEHINETQK